MLFKLSLNIVDVPNRLPIFKHFPFSVVECDDIVFWKRSIYCPSCCTLFSFLFTKNRKHTSITICTVEFI